MGIGCPCSPAVRATRPSDTGPWPASIRWSVESPRRGRCTAPYRVTVGVRGRVDPRGRRGGPPGGDLDVLWDGSRDRSWRTSLVRRVGRNDVPELRFSMLETIREYAAASARRGPRPAERDGLLDVRHYVERSAWSPRRQSRTSPESTRRDGSTGSGGGSTTATSAPCSIGPNGPWGPRPTAGRRPWVTAAAIWRFLVRNGVTWRRDVRCVGSGSWPLPAAARRVTPCAPAVLGALGSLDYWMGDYVTMADATGRRSR